MREVDAVAPSRGILCLQQDVATHEVREASQSRASASPLPMSSRYCSSGQTIRRIRRLLRMSRQLQSAPRYSR